MLPHGRQFSPFSHRKAAAEENTDSWLMSYADMITLLMCFFIIFVSVSEPKRDRLAAVTEGIQGKFSRVELSTPYLGTFRALQGVVEKNQMFLDTVVEKTDRGLEIEFASQSYFQPGTAEIEPSKMESLFEMMDALKNANFAQYAIIVEGHTDDVEVSNAFFPSNWELSALRATKIIRLMGERGVNTSHMRAVGYAGTLPLVPNIDAKGNAIPENREKNQRIVIKLEQKL